MQLYNKSWRSILEKVTYAHHAALLPYPGGGISAGVFLKSAAQQCPVLRHGFALSAFASTDDALHGTRPFLRAEF